MLKTSRIQELEQMRGRAFVPPFVLMERLEDADFRNETWMVILAQDTNSDEARWLALFPETGEAVFFTEGNHLRGRWDEERKVFFPDEGEPLNLLGRAVSVISLDDEEEGEEDEPLD